MNYPESALITGLISAINAELPTRTVYTVPPKDSSYPYILINQTFMEQIGTKDNYIYRFEPLIQVVHKDLSSISPILSDMNAIHQIIKASDELVISGYDVMQCILINTNRTTELYDAFKLDIGLIRARIEIQ
jgi:hypothetical protein